MQASAPIEMVPPASLGRWRGLLILGVVLSLLLLSLAALLGWRDYRLRDEQAATRADLVAQGIERQLQERLARLSEELSAYAALASDGYPLAKTGVTPGLRTGAVRDLVFLHDDGRVVDGDGLARSRPAVPVERGTATSPMQILAPVAGSEALVVVQDGLPGVRVMAEVDPQWFAEMLQGHDLGPGSVVTLLHGKQLVLARSLDNARHRGRALLGSKITLPEHQSNARGHFHEDSVIGGESRQFVYRRIANTPLTVVVGTMHQAITSPAQVFLILAISVALALGLMWWWLLRAFITADQRHGLLLQQLQQTAVRLRDTQVMASIGAWSWNLSTDELHWSDEIFHLYGRDPAEGPPSRELAWSYVHPEDASRLWTSADQVVDTGAPVEAEFRIRRVDGAERRIHLRGEVVELAHGRVFHGIQQDITALAAVRERLRQAQAIASIGDWEWDLDSGAILWSDTIYAIYGRDKRAFVPHADNVFDCMHAEDRPRVQALVSALVETGMPCKAEYRIVRPDGTVRVVSSTALLETGADGQKLLRAVQQDITELAQSRDNLREVELQYRFLFEHNPIPMWVFDRETLAFLAVNDAMLGHYGYSRQALLDASILDIRPPEERALVEIAARRLSADEPQGAVWTHRRADGSRIRAAIFAHDIVFNGREAQLIAAQDVTEREASEQRFQLVARATSDVVWDLDPQIGSLWWSESFFRTFGYGVEDVAPTLAAWEALVHADDRERVSKTFQAAMDDLGASEWEQQYRFRHRDGRDIDILDRGIMLRDAGGKVVRVVGGMLDITEKHRHESELRLLSRAMEATDNGVVIADARLPDQPLVYANRAFEEMTGYAAEEVIGRNCRFLQGQDHDQFAVEGIRHAIREGREVRVLLRNYRKDGNIFWNEFHLAPVLDEGGALTHFVGVLNDVSQRHRYEEELAHRATHDQLTGLPNRQLLQDRLQQAILNADRYGREAAAVFIDLDDFKLINDNLGHAAGDEALRIVATRLRSQVRDTDTVGRFGGDEFVIVLTEQTDDAGVGRVIERVGKALSEPMQVGGMEHTVTPSIGWCRYPEGGADAEALLKHADMAMYQAKRQGRNRAVPYRPEFDASASQRLQLVAQLREGLDRREFVLAFQPLFDGTGRPVALEALMRWQHPERGLLPPSEFIAVCEESGLIVELGRRALREAARHHRLLAAAGHGHLRLAVNVSVLQFGHDLDLDVAAVIREFDLPRGILELEITESVIMESPERVIDTMRRISELGVCLSVDDFGTGYSSLSYLKRLPIDRLKIDRSFVQDLPGDRDAASICSAVIGMAHSLGIETVGEGVETEEQLRWLREAGCDEVQGYLLARPALFDGILKLLSGVQGDAAA